MIAVLPYNQPQRLVPVEWDEVDPHADPDPVTGERPTIPMTTEFSVVRGKAPDLTQWVAYEQDLSPHELAVVEAAGGFVLADRDEFNAWLKM